MDYRDILKAQFQRRKEFNPRYSLRSFAVKLDLAPSKVSEVLSGKKKLSVERLEDIAKRLQLQGKEKEIFLLSAELESSKTIDKSQLAQKLKKLAQQIQAEKTQQRNAWYFGAVNALSESEMDPEKYADQMGVTELQVENALRYQKRMQRFYPEREDLTFEPVSLAKKISESLENVDSPVHGDFALLTQEEVQELTSKVRSLIKKYKTDRKSKKPEDLRLVYFGAASILGKGD
ncbi:hypothetical protein [Bdellovibrio sp. HCB337]|uniref:hypothetical protein n=1 Tax=Bdellovibrio sp. HCB337 TaxID=3394358 RepID=UPI0039A61DC0